MPPQHLQFLQFLPFVQPPIPEPIPLPEPAVPPLPNVTIPIARTPFTPN